jgi:CNT family concentrative nucleoside transporter
LPEVSQPETSGLTPTEKVKSPYVNAVDAAASGTADGLRLALNVGAMLIVFIAFVAMFDGILGLIDTAWLNGKFGWSLPDEISLQWIFGQLFSPVAFLMGVDSADQQKVGSLLGSKLAINEHYAYLQMKAWKATPDFMSERSYMLAAFALTGFANFSSVGIQLGGIGAMAPGGFTATLLNAAVAGMML